MNARRVLLWMVGATAVMLPGLAGAVVVEEGDTLWGLTTERYGREISADQLCRIATLNGIEDPDLIFTGDDLWLPWLKRLPNLAECEVASGLDGSVGVESPSTPADPPVADPEPEYDDYSIWDSLAECESGGDWHINTGNGYYGGIQFSLSSWQAVGGSGYPHENSREEQIYRGELLLAASGWGAWPSCAAQLGLR